MAKLLKSLKKMLGVTAIVAVLTTSLTIGVKADEASDAALIAQQQYQQALVAQQQQQALLLQQYQQAMAVQQQQLLAQQYAAAVEIQNQFLKQHANAAQQAFMMQQMQNLQFQQYQAMVQRCGLDYQSTLLNEYQKYQNAALKSFLGYNGY